MAHKVLFPFLPPFLPAAPEQAGIVHSFILPDFSARFNVQMTYIIHPIDAKNLDDYNEVVCMDMSKRQADPAAFGHRTAAVFSTAGTRVRPPEKGVLQL